MSDEFDRERFETLAAKAAANDLDPSEVEEFRVQLDELKELYIAIMEILRECWTDTDRTEADR